MSVLVGTCGYRYYDPGEAWQETYESTLQAYADAFAVGELNRTFYELPQVSTAERWRREAGDSFTFAVKAWQAVTHPWQSPTWNGHRDDVPDEWTEDVGYLRPTEAVLDAWDRTVARAAALDAAVVVVQTPPSFGCTDEHEANVREVFATVDRGDVDVAWEPRGDWHDHPDRVRALCEDLDLVHVVDLLRDEPLDDTPVTYTRLHGLNEDRYDYDYEYDAAELDDLAGRLRARAETDERVYCLFNNYEMYDDARALADRLGTGAAG